VITLALTVVSIFGVLRAWDAFRSIVW